MFRIPVLSYELPYRPAPAFGGIGSYPQRIFNSPVTDSPAPTIPDCLRERDQWVCWKFIERDGKLTKCPIAARGGPASATDPTTWASYSEAQAACRADPMLAGVGFVFSAADPFAGIDLDNCLEAGTCKPKPWAAAILARFSTYAEVSPSGKGVKLFVRASKPGSRCKTGHHDGAIEIYTSGRFFTVTGQRLPDAPLEVNKAQTAVTELYEQAFGAAPAARPSALPIPPASHALEFTADDKILQRARAARNSAKFEALWAGGWQGSYPSQSEADAALVCMLAFYSRDADQLDRLFRQSGLMRPKWDSERGERSYGAQTIDRALRTVTEPYRSEVARGGSYASSPPTATVAAAATDGARPTVRIDTDEHRVVSESISALRADPDLYQRGGTLVRVLSDTAREDGIDRPLGSFTISLLPSANLRERTTRYAAFTKCGKKDDGPAHPPPWLAGAIECRGDWPGIRHLTGVSDAPILRADGSVWQTRGYDAVSGVLYQPAVDFPRVPGKITPTDVRAAVDELREVVCDFRFESEAHMSAWLAGLLTPLARFAFGGPSPLFLIDANVRGAGKGLLAQTIAAIVLGRAMPVSSYAHQSEELRKKITSIAIAGDRMILFDNIEGEFGNDTLDRALTSTRWKDRLLGKNEEIDLPLLPVWYATGNNVQIAADTTRRVIHIRLDVLEERPEHRADFRHADLLAWIVAQRGRLLRAALVILAGHLRCGARVAGLTPFGSFEGWSAVVREAVISAGLPDPCLTRIRLAEFSDTGTDALSQLIAAWDAYADGRGFTVAALLRDLYPPGANDSQACFEMRAALENLVGCPPGKPPTARQIGNRLKAIRRRVVNGRCFDCDTGYNRSGAIWRLLSGTAAA